MYLEYLEYFFSELGFHVYLVLHQFVQVQCNVITKKHWVNIKVQANVQSIDWTLFIQSFLNSKDRFVVSQQHLWASSSFYA